MTLQSEQKSLAFRVLWLSISVLVLGITISLVFSDCLPCCPDVVGGGCLGNLDGSWPVCCTKYTSSPYGKVHIGCCDYTKFKINCLGGGTVVLYILEKRHFNDDHYIWWCISTPTTGRCVEFSRSSGGGE